MRPLLAGAAIVVTVVMLTLAYGRFVGNPPITGFRWSARP